MKSFRFALSLLTTIPSGFKDLPDEKTFLSSVNFFPLCGYILGFFCVLSFYALSHIFYINDIIEAIGITALLFLLTGGLHLDGFADSCDALMCSAPPSKRIEILHDSRLGAFATIGLILLLSAKICAIFILIRENEYWSIFSMIVIARFIMVFLIKIGQFYPFERGMGKEIIGKIPWLTVFVTFLYTAPCIFMNWDILITTIILILIVIYFNSRVKAKLGGISGDILGASVELSETLGLVLLTIKLL
ncbi:MAG TPA: adenosylcobinamide-GDP ribazoletransferase [Lentisphaeria bacterium]|nr:MAG: cobalamin 5'-phosphate synthase [Lentisphaerae bacterium GWF2_38_69]HBM16532.1 adenosylcobinamide-GDP ribazoletransferase [Lentisphaeria bacterium]